MSENDCCEYMYQTGKKKGEQCTFKKTNLCQLDKYCCQHYRMRSRKIDNPVPPELSIPEELLIKFEKRYEEEIKRMNEEALYRKYKMKRMTNP